MILMPRGLLDNIPEDNDFRDKEDCNEGSENDSANVDSSASTLVLEYFLFRNLRSKNDHINKEIRT